MRLADGVHWIRECFDLGGRHMHASAYLLSEDGGEGSVLVDTGAFAHRDAIAREIDRLTDGRGVDAMVLSKAHEPHSGNVHAFSDAWGSPRLIASSGVPDLYGLPDAEKATAGESMTVAGRELHFVDPPLLDVAHSTWIFDSASGTLFTADGFGHYHDPGECDRTSADLGGIAAEDVHDFHREMLLWLELVDPDRLVAAVRDLFDAYPVETVAPIHGNPVVGTDIEGYVDALESSIRRIAGE